MSKLLRDSVSEAVLARLEDLNNSLNPEQLSGAESLYGPIMLVAGAGAGKTRTLTHRAATMIEVGISPLNLLIVTFTNKAATELKERLEEMVGENATFICAGTFHSIIFREILSVYKESAYLKEVGIDMHETSILDDGDAKKLLREAFDSLDEEDQRAIEDNEWKLAQIEQEMSLARSKGYTAEEFNYYITAGSNNELLSRITFRTWKTYNKLCRNINGIDFDDILVYCAHMLEREKSISDELGKRFQYIMLDEYQDTNPVQMRIMDAIAASHRNIFVVGDEKQAIYGFRGSDVKVILGFIDRYPEAQIINMGRNYRSNPLIIDCANAVAEAMNQRVPNSDGQLKAESKLPPVPPKLAEFGTSESEANAIVAAIQRDLREGIPGKEIAVLYRSRNIKQELERKLVEKDIPYFLVGDTAFFQKAEVKDAVAFLKFTFQPWDSMAALRVLKTVRIGVSEAKAKEAMQKEGLTVYDFLKRESQRRLKTSKKGVTPPLSKSAQKVQAFLRPIEAVLQGYEHFDDPAFTKEFLAEIWDIFYKPQMEKAARRSTSNQNQDTVDLKVENVSYILDRLEETLKQGMTIEEALEELSLMVQASPDLDRELDNKIRLMTMHASKGLEFQSCYVIGCDNEAISAKEDESFDVIEENRRILYVAFTRAMSKLVITWTRERLIHGQYTPVIRSPFIDEIVNMRSYQVAKFK